MTISSFDDLLLQACQQPQGQRVLMVFASTELPDDATPAQRADFDQGLGGALVPVMCVDKTPDEIGNFDRLAQEANQFNTDWKVLFVSTLSGHSDAPPSTQDADPHLQNMVEAIKMGALNNMIAFDTAGFALELV